MKMIFWSRARDWWVVVTVCLLGYLAFFAAVRSAEGGGYVIDQLGEVGYIRPGSLPEKGAEKVGDELERMGEEGMTMLVFDLRAVEDGGGVRGAAFWLDLFLAKEEVGFWIRGAEGKVAPVRSVTEPKWAGDLVLLVDEEMGNVGEVVAWALSKKRVEIVFGSPTAGRGAFYSEAEGELVLSAEVLLDADGAPLSGRKLEPGCRVDFGLEARARAFVQVSEWGLGPVVRERVRPRRSEASLIDGTDPELPYLLAQSAAESGEEPSVTGWGLVVDDPVLRAALDMMVAVKALDLEERIEHVKRREWRLSETRRKLEELRIKEAAEKEKTEGEEEVKAEVESGTDETEGGEGNG